MKLAKTALVLALASAGTMAAAESQVTLYGTIDGAVVVNKAKGGDATVSLDDGIAGGSVWGIGRQRRFRKRILRRLSFGKRFYYG